MRLGARDISELIEGKPHKTDAGPTLACAFKHLSLGSLLLADRTERVHNIAGPQRELFDRQVISP